VTFRVGRKGSIRVGTGEAMKEISRGHIRAGWVPGGWGCQPGDVGPLFRSDLWQGAAPFSARRSRTIWTDAALDGVKIALDRAKNSSPTASPCLIEGSTEEKTEESAAWRFKRQTGPADFALSIQTCRFSHVDVGGRPSRPLSRFNVG